MTRRPLALLALAGVTAAIAIPALAATPFGFYATVSCELSADERSLVGRVGVWAAVGIEGIILSDGRTAYPEPAVPLEVVWPFHDGDLDYTVDWADAEPVTYELRYSEGRTCPDIPLLPGETSTSILVDNSTTSIVYGDDTGLLPPPVIHGPSQFREHRWTCAHPESKYPDDCLPGDRERER